MARTPQEIFGHHATALIAGDIDGIVEDYADDALFITWSATSAKARVTDGVDTFVFRDGLIRVQTVRCTVEPVG